MFNYMAIKNGEQSEAGSKKPLSESRDVKIKVYGLPDFEDW